MNKREKCMNFCKNPDFTLPTSIGGFRGPGMYSVIFINVKVVSPLKIQRASFRIVENPWKILNKSVALKS
jgi:hypothetical protein